MTDIGKPKRIIEIEPAEMPTQVPAVPASPPVRERPEEPVPA